MVDGIGKPIVCLLLLQLDARKPLLKMYTCDCHRPAIRPSADRLASQVCQCSKICQCSKKYGQVWVCKYNLRRWWCRAAACLCGVAHARLLRSKSGARPDCNAVNVCAFTARCPLGSCPAPAGRVRSPAARENPREHRMSTAGQRHPGTAAATSGPPLKAQRTTGTPQPKRKPCLQVAQRVLRLRVGQAAHKVDVEEVVEGALCAAAARLCG